MPATNSATRQNGNNNAYAQDNEITWLNWLGINARGRALREFTRKLIATRKAFPILYRGRFVIGSHNEELDVKDVTWLSPAGEEMATEQWQDGNARCFGMLLDGRAQESGVKRRGSDATLLLIYNAHHDVVNFTLPSVPEGRHWQGLIDTNRPDSALGAFSFGDARTHLLGLSDGGAGIVGGGRRHVPVATGTGRDPRDAAVAGLAGCHFGRCSPGRRYHLSRMAAAFLPSRSAARATSCSLRRRPALLWNPPTTRLNNAPAAAFRLCC